MTKALLLTSGSEAFETATTFIGKVDKFFDCLNVTSFTKAHKTRKPFQRPYFNADDFCLKI